MLRMSVFARGERKRSSSINRFKLCILHVSCYVQIDGVKLPKFKFMGSFVKFDARGVGVGGWGLLRLKGVEVPFSGLQAS